MGIAGVVERGAAGHSHGDGAADRFDASDDFAETGSAAFDADGHVVDDLDDAVAEEEAGDEDVGFGPVDLLAGGGGGGGGDFEMAAFFLVENSGEDAGGIEVGETKPIDGAVQADQGGGLGVADQAVVFDGLIRHKPS